MPLYEYVCQYCGANFEKMVRFSEQDLEPECPACHSKEARKRISLFAAGGSSVSSLANSGCASASSGFR